MESWLSQELIFSGRIFSVFKGKAQVANGPLVDREVVAHQGGVAVVPVLGDQVMLIRQFRIAVNQSLLEIPAGRLEDGDTPEGRAQLELEEEIGYRAGSLVLAARYYASAGYTSEQMHLFLGQQLEPSFRKPDADEHIEVVPVPIVAIPTLLAGGGIQDAKTIIGLYALLAHR
jgi:ADP-ribose pyrophosphatase